MRSVSNGAFNYSGYAPKRLGVRSRTDAKTFGAALKGVSLAGWADGSWRARWPFDGPYLKRKCSPGGEHFAFPGISRVMYMGESDSTASQPPKPVCDWSLGRAANEVKKKIPLSSRSVTPVSIYTYKE